jgi:hypothetical protein
MSIGGSALRRSRFSLPNPWDAGTSTLLVSLGFEALGQPPPALAWPTRRRADGEGSVSRAELLENCRVTAEATDLPVDYTGMPRPKQESSPDGRIKDKPSRRHCRVPEQPRRAVASSGGT